MNLRKFYKLQSDRFPPVITLGIVVLCLLPALLILFELPYIPSHYIQRYPESRLIQTIFYENKLEVLYEWTAFCTAAFLAVLCFFLYSLKRDPTVLVIGFALFFAGFLDGFHAIAIESHFYDGIDAQNLEAVSWFLARCMTAIILILEVVMVLYIFPCPTRRQENVLIVLAMITLILICIATAYFLLASDLIPLHLYPDRLIARPYELIPLFLFFLCYPFLRLLFNKFPGYFSYSLMLSLIPCIAMELYIIFTPLFYEYQIAYDASHAIKILFFLIPFLGICFQLYYIYRDSAFLISKNDELKRLDEQRTHFVGMVSHDLRNPASAIQLSADFYLKMSPDQETTTDLMKTIYSTSTHMITLLNDFLDLSTIDSGKMKMEFKEVNLIALINEIVAENRALTSSKSLTLSHNQHSESVIGYCDLERVREVLSNFISNAIKFCHEGGSITFKCEDQVDSVVIHVTDTGVGIPEDKMHALFDANQYYTTKGTHGERGTGLGLAICYKIIKANNGEIWAESIPGQGSTFAIKLPKPAPQQVQEVNAPS